MMRSGYEEVPPRADAIVASMRSMGYDLSMAIADLVDNSIFAKCTHIGIDYHWDATKSWIRVLDDGIGMSEAALKEAMRLGSISPNEKRAADDLGRFGLGLKTASFSQCKILTVRTKTQEGQVSTRCWDIDHIEETKKWELGILPPHGTDEILSDLNEMPNGTIVLWQGLDRVIAEVDPDEKARDVFYEKFMGVKNYLEMVFHRYLSPPINLKIRVGRHMLRPWDPYLRSNRFAQELSKEKYEDGTVRVVPFVLPHVSKRTEDESALGAGPKGWNAQQGFYLYRNRRMIVSGGYFDLGLKPEEHCKLARIMVDITNDMDREWSIDVRKASAIPPDRLRPELEKAAKATRAEAIKVYRARLGVPRRSPRQSNQQVWIKMTRGDKVLYKINPENDVIRKLLLKTEMRPKWIKVLFQVIESTVPHRLIIMDNSEREDCQVDLPADMHTPNQELIDLCKEFYLQFRRSGKTRGQALDLVIQIEPFNTHPLYLATLEELKMELD
jgi:hypothetical protein